MVSWPPAIFVAKLDLLSHLPQQRILKHSSEPHMLIFRICDRHIYSDWPRYKNNRPCAYPAAITFQGLGVISSLLLQHHESCMAPPFRLLVEDTRLAVNLFIHSVLEFGHWLRQRDAVNTSPPSLTIHGDVFPAPGLVVRPLDRRRFARLFVHQVPGLCSILHRLRVMQLCDGVFLAEGTECLFMMHRP